MREYQKWREESFQQRKSIKFIDFLTNNENVKKFCDWLTTRGKEKERQGVSYEKWEQHVKDKFSQWQNKVADMRADLDWMDWRDHE